MRFGQSLAILHCDMNITLHAPQIIMLLMLALGSGMYLAKNGEPKTGTYSFGASLISDAIIVGILYWGGFFG